MSCFSLCKTRKPDDIALSYYDSLLRVRDVSLLGGRHWINDQIIQFYFEYMERSLFKEQRHFLFIHPSVTRAMRDNEDYQVYLDPLNAERKRFIFMALNNSSTVDDTGTHWTLLVFSRTERAFFHYDSLTSASSLSLLRPFLNSLSRALGCPEYHYVEAECKIQINGYDCGMFVMYNAEVLARRIVNYGSIVPDAETILCAENKQEGYDDPLQIRYIDVTYKRDKILEIIEDLGGQI